MISRLTPITLAALLVAMLLTPTVRAGDKDADEQTRKVVRTIADYYKSLDSLTVNAKVDMTLSMGGQQQTNNSRFAIAMKRPKQFALRLTEGERGGDYVTNGKRVWAYVASAKRYSANEAPATLDAALDDDLIGMFSAGAGDFVGLLLRSDPYKAVFEDITAAKYIGKEKLGDIECHRLRFDQANIGLDLWVQTGDTPLVHKVVPDFSAAQAARPGTQPKVDMTITFTDWKPNAKIDASAFAFTPPAGAERVASLLGNPLLGKPAPAFNLTGLDGKQHALAAHKGKDIVILDFWTTWCGWCTKTMPTIENLAEQYKDKNVVLYAVNVREPAEQARKYMDENKLDANHVIRDADGSTSNAFGVEGFPTTVIIGKDGTIQSVYSGVPGGDPRLLAQQLTSDLEKLLAGKKLADLSD